MKKKQPVERKRNTGISLHPSVIALLEKYRGRKSRSLYAEEIITSYFRQRDKRLDLSEKNFLESDSL